MNRVCAQLPSRISPGPHSVAAHTGSVVWKAAHRQEALVKSPRTLYARLFVRSRSIRPTPGSATHVAT